MNIDATGAYKPLSAFAVRVTEGRKDVVFTVLITGGMMYRKFMQELAKLSVSRLEEIRSRINVVDLTGQDVNPLIPLAEFRPALEAIYSSKPITCKATGTVLQGLPPPTVALIDPFAGYAVEAIRDIAGSKCSILSWMTAPAGATLRLVGPEEYGGVGDLSPKVEAEVALTGKSYAEVATDLYANFASGEIINVPGIPAMYDYEWVPQEYISQLRDGKYGGWGAHGSIGQIVDYSRLRECNRYGWLVFLVKLDSGPNRVP
ncbi:hypothetical protein C8R42DRAFT_726517 [Lentinula raphanica]|nr:hypothetical protein C8R42DRAFT_726517 [Lentinula raphanica]